MAVIRRPARIDVEIDELVLTGFAAADRFRIGDALQAELTRLLTERGRDSDVLSADGVSRLDAGSIRLSDSTRAGHTGRLIARAVHGALRTDVDDS